VAVETGKATALDLGSDRPEALWSGVVRLTGGVIVRGKGSMVLSRADAVGYLVVPFDEEGRFSQRMAPGLYEAPNVSLPGVMRREVRARSPVRVGESDLSVDVELPGARVSGVVLDRATREPLAKRTDQWIAWTPEGKDHFARQSVHLGADGRFVLDGVLPGRYVLSGWPLALRDGAGRPSTFEVREGAAETTVEAHAVPE
jgi:hypothetical protein